MDWLIHNWTFVLGALSFVVTINRFLTRLENHMKHTEETETAILKHMEKTNEALAILVDRGRK